LHELLAGGGYGTVAVVIDPGRRGAGEGRVLLWRRAGCAAKSGEDGPRTVTPEEIAAGLFRAVGLPQSAELPAPPTVCPWPEPPARVPSFGRREGAAPGGAGSDEYLQNLRSLGYV
jgi:hypothetical protein